LAGYFDVIERGGVSTNVASFVGLGNIWQCVMARPTAPSAAQFERMKTACRRGDEEWRFRLVVHVGHAADALATTDEIVELCKVAAAMAASS